MSDFIGLVLLLSNIVAAQMPLAASSLLVLTLHPEQPSFETTGPVRLVCKLTNRGSVPLSVPVLFLPEFYFVRFEIVGPDGKTVPFRGPEIKAKISAQDIVMLKPDMFVGAAVDVTGKSSGAVWYDFSAKGHYTVKAIYAVPAYIGPSLGKSDAWSGQISSPAVTLDIK